MGQPSISVVIPCYNGGALLAETLNSALAQSVAPDEILLVDDGSTDNTAEIVAGFGDRVRYFHGPNFGAPARPRNIGFREAAGDLIAFFDADDLMGPDKIRAALAVFSARPEVDFLFTNFATCDERGQMIKPDFLAEYQDFRRYLRPDGDKKLGLISGADVYRCLLRANFIGTSSVVCRAGALRRVGPFDESMKNSSDLDMWRRIARAGHTFAFLDEVHHSYRIRSDSISHGGSRLFPAWIKGFEKQLSVADDPADLRYIRTKLDELWLAYGYALRIEGQRGPAVEAYLTALRRTLSWSGIKGLLLSLVTSRHS